MPTGFLFYRKSIHVLLIVAVITLAIEWGRDKVKAEVETASRHEKQIDQSRIPSPSASDGVEMTSTAAVLAAPDKQSIGSSLTAAAWRRNAEGGNAGQRRFGLAQPHSAKAGQEPEARPALTAVKSFSVLATGYTAGIESTGKRPGHPLYGITRSGVKVKRGQISTIAADTKVLPIGTLLYVPGYGYGVVADTGSKIKGKRIDLYFDTTRQVYKEWGKKEVTVHVLRYGSGKLDQRMLNRLSETVKAGGFKEPKKLKL